MSCDFCTKLEQNTDLKDFHVIRICEKCGDEFRIRELGEHGIGFKIKKGDKVVAPAEALRISANPLKARGELTRAGLEWFAELVFGVEVGGREGIATFADKLEAMQEASEEGVIDLPLLADLDLSDVNQTEIAFQRLNQSPKSVEWWKFLSASFYFNAREAIKEGDPLTAAWACVSAERFRSLAIFKENFEEVVFMGHSAGKLVKLLSIWEANKANSEEGFWQRILQDHAYAFAQLFSAPVTFIEGGAYVGGTKIDGSEARYLDFLLSGGTANHALLVEIKTPTTKLLSGKYRKNVYPASRELSGSIIQINDYCDTLRKSIDLITKNSNINLNTFNPRRIVLIGNYEEQLDNETKRSSFELFRASLGGIEIVTFDEFFKKIEQLAQIFNLIRRK